MDTVSQISLKKYIKKIPKWASQREPEDIPWNNIRKRPREETDSKENLSSSVWHRIMWL